MRTNIEINDKLMNEVFKATGVKTKKEAGTWLKPRFRSSFLMV